MQKTPHEKVNTGSAVSPKIAHPNRIIDASIGVTKIELMRYYDLVASLILPHLKGRPVSLVRAPGGVEGRLILQKDLDDIRLKGVRIVAPNPDRGHPPLIEIGGKPGLLSAAEMNAVEFHTWNTTKVALEKPDRLIFDLDPGEGANWDDVRQAAILMNVFLSELGLQSLLKTSGGKGLHIVVPIIKRYEWDTVTEFSHAIVNHLASTFSQLFCAKSGSKHRMGKVFVDYLRNGFGATTISAWSARARKGMAVSVPIAWDELDKVADGAQWNVHNIYSRLVQGNQAWKEFKHQGIAQAMQILDFASIER